MAKKRRASKILNLNPKIQAKKKATAKAPKSAATKKVLKAAEPVATSTTPIPSKKVSQKLIETIEKRKKAQEGASKGNMFGRPPVRRGRRPKAAQEYTPYNNEDEAYPSENEYEGLEYDTGIRVKEGGEDRGFSLDRVEDFDEELNFDR